MTTVQTKIKKAIPGHYKTIFLTVHAKSNPTKTVHACTSLFMIDLIPTQLLTKDHFIQVDQLHNDKIVDWIEIDLEGLTK